MAKKLAKVKYIRGAKAPQSNRVMQNELATAKVIRGGMAPQSASVPQTPMPTINQVPQTPIPSADSLTQQIDMMEQQQAKMNQPWLGMNIYDRSIGGYGKANPGETGTAAIERIKSKKKVQVKKK